MSLGLGSEEWDAAALELQAADNNHRVTRKALEEWVTSMLDDLEFIHYLRRYAEREQDVDFQGYLFRYLNAKDEHTSRSNHFLRTIRGTEYI